MQMLTLEEFKKLAETAKRIAVFQEIPLAHHKPIDLYMSLCKSYQQGIIFENLENHAETDLSYLCFEPIANLSIYPQENRNPFNELRQYQAQYQFDTRENMHDYITSAAGFITYDTIRYCENIHDKHAPNQQLPEFMFNFYAISVTFCYSKQTILISYIVNVSKDLEKTYQTAQETIATIIAKIGEGNGADLEKIKKQPITSATIHRYPSDEQFMEKVEQAKQYIQQGEVFQLVLSRCFTRNYEVPPLEIYQALCKQCPAPFMFYIPLAGLTILGASPERFIRVHNQHITVNPIAGTRKRTSNQDDKALQQQLLSDEKELAEHMMLVDLARNDVGAVAKPGSVEVKELLQVKNYTHVSHITSTVTGELKDSKDALHAFCAAFPAGTLTGAPKIRAMQLIDELETARRGIYGGAICRLDASGNFDSCIAIRMATLENGLATVRTGAGIVYDSNPYNEAQETCHKAYSMLAAIAIAHGENHDSIN